eukprot:6785650-Prymnesium_polylepis.2
MHDTPGSARGSQYNWIFHEERRAIDSAERQAEAARGAASAGERPNLHGGSAASLSSATADAPEVEAEPLEVVCRAASFARKRKLFQSLCTLTVSATTPSKAAAAPTPPMERGGRGGYATTPPMERRGRGGDATPTPPMERGGRGDV